LSDHEPDEILDFRWKRAAEVTGGSMDRTIRRERVEKGRAEVI
jgi:hypothetical protein